MTFADGNGVELTYVSGNGTTGDAGDAVTGLDRFGRVVDQNWVNGSGTSVDEEKYAYDQDSNVLSRTNTVIASQSEQYTYDGLNRLATFARGTFNGNGTFTASENESWSLDAAGNWTGNTVGTSTTTRTNSAQNQVKTVGSATLGYDADGNTLTDQAGQQYAYDAWNRLVAVKTSGGATVAAYTYDARGRRVTETESGTTTALYYSADWQVLEARTGTTAGNAAAAASSQQSVWSPFDVDGLVERDSQPNAGGTALTQRLYAEQDADDNVTSLTGSGGTVNGVVLERYAYDPYGSVTVENAADGSEKGTGPTAGTAAASGYGWTVLHQGLRLDVATGTYDDRNRVYLVTLGRFAQADPAGYVDGANVYQLELSSPASNQDPSGLNSREGANTDPNAANPGPGLWNPPGDGHRFAPDWPVPPDSGEDGGASGVPGLGGSGRQDGGTPGGDTNPYGLPPNDPSDVPPGDLGELGGGHGGSGGGRGGRGGSSKPGTGGFSGLLPHGYTGDGQYHWSWKFWSTAPDFKTRHYDFGFSFVPVNPEWYRPEFYFGATPPGLPFEHKAPPGGYLEFRWRFKYGSGNGDFYFGGHGEESGKRPNGGFALGGELYF